MGTNPMLVVIGEALVDLVASPDGSTTAHAGGGPLNAARAAARLGANVGFLGVLSSDRFGSMLAETLDADGVRSLVLQRSVLPTTLAVAHIGADGAASYGFYWAATSAFDASLIDLETVDATDCAAVHVGSLALAVDQMVARVPSWLDQLRAMSDRETTVMVDLNARTAMISDLDEFRRHVEPVLARCDIVKVSTDDLDVVFPGQPHREVITGLLSMGPSIVLCTDGPNPMSLHWATHHVAVEVPQVTVADTIGAGDTFGAAFLTHWMRHSRTVADLAAGDLVHDAALWAARAAAAACTRRGANPPTLDELTASTPA